MAEADTATLESTVPTLQVTDLSAAIAFYRDVLGFELGWTWGDPPRRASVRRDHVELAFVESAAAASATSNVYVHTTGIDDYYRRVCRSDAVTVPIGYRPYGMRDFSIVDPSGNQLTFGEPIRK
jgi:catechol 2,3-dioxygenase-like lactoylglutathione lyase family enzyme